MDDAIEGETTIGLGEISVDQNILHDKILNIHCYPDKIQSCRRFYIHARNISSAVLFLIKKGKIGENYNIGSGMNLKNLDIAKKLIKIVKNKSLKINKKAKIKFVKDRPGHDFRYALNNKKILKKLGWKAKISLKIGLKKTFDWYLNNEAFFKSVSKKIYTNRIGLKL